MNNWRDYEMAGVDIEDWPPLVREDYEKAMILNREEKYDREHPDAEPEDEKPRLRIPFAGQFKECLRCARRELGCHEKCPEYQAYRRWREALRKERMRTQDADAHTREVVEKIRKRKNR